MELKPPLLGQRVIFGHLLLSGEREGIVEEVTGACTTLFDRRRVPTWECTVRVLNEPRCRAPIKHCLWVETADGPIPASHWQYCRPIPATGTCTPDVTCIATMHPSPEASTEGTKSD